MQSPAVGLCGLGLQDGNPTDYLCPPLTCFQAITYALPYLFLEACRVFSPLSCSIDLSTGISPCNQGLMKYIVPRTFAGDSSFGLLSIDITESRIDSGV